MRFLRAIRDRPQKRHQSGGSVSEKCDDLLPPAPSRNSSAAASARSRRVSGCRANSCPLILGILEQFDFRGRRKKLLERDLLVDFFAMGWQQTDLHPLLEQQLAQYQVVL